MTSKRGSAGHPPWATAGEMRLEGLVILGLFITTIAMYAYLFLHGTQFTWGDHPSSGPNVAAATSRGVPALTLPPPPARHDFYMPDIVPRTYNTEEISFLARLNGQRSPAGLRPLQASTALNYLADIRVRQMIDQRYVGHVDPYGYTMYTELLSLFAITYKQAGEIVGKVGVSDDPALAITTAFMNSPEHRANILSPDFTLVGVAEEDAADGAHYFAAIFLE